MNAADAPLAALCRGILFRRLFKTIDLSHLDGAEAAKRLDAASAAIAAAGGDASYDLVYDEPSDTGYETYQDSAGEGEIRNGKLEVPGSRQIPWVASPAKPVR